MLSFVYFEMPRANFLVERAQLAIYSHLKCSTIFLNIWTLTRVFEVRVSGAFIGGVSTVSLNSDITTRALKSPVYLSCQNEGEMDFISSHEGAE